MILCDQILCYFYNASGSPCPYVKYLKVGFLFLQTVDCCFNYIIYIDKISTLFSILKNIKRLLIFYLSRKDPLANSLHLYLPDKLLHVNDNSISPHHKSPVMKLPSFFVPSVDYWLRYPGARLSLLY